MSGSDSPHLHGGSSPDTAQASLRWKWMVTRRARDAATLAATVAAVTRADVMLVAVHPGAPVVFPEEMGWVAVHQRAADMVHELRDLLVAGSSTGAPLARVRIDNRTRQLLGQAQCAAAIAPIGLFARPLQKLEFIGVV
jgi:hypothetical protein